MFSATNLNEISLLLYTLLAFYLYWLDFLYLPDDDPVNEIENNYFC